MRRYIIPLKSLMGMLINSDGSLKNMHRNEFEEYVIMVEGTLKMGQIKWFDIISLSRGSKFNMGAHTYF